MSSINPDVGNAAFLSSHFFSEFYWKNLRLFFNVNEKQQI